MERRRAVTATSAADLLLEVAGIRKDHQGLRPLRLNRIAIGRGDACAIAGMDAMAAEAFVLLLTGASLPDEGEVRVFGTNTRDIPTDTAWLASLDRIGLVTERAVLLDQLAVVQNLALPLTLAVDPLPADVRARVVQLAEDVALGADRLDRPVAELPPHDRMRVHLARALALGPELLLLEHPTAHLDPGAAKALGATLRRVAAARGLAWIALTEDDGFARAAGGTRLRLNAATGELGSEGGFWRTLVSGQRAKGRGQK
jgi:ABC-type transporter Mla maintaining outer membrane lipid asymmetry ATPase subunit MlaF